MLPVAEEMKRLLAKKAEAKTKSLAAVAAAKLDERNRFCEATGTDPKEATPEKVDSWRDADPENRTSSYWNTVYEYGYSQGVEGQTDKDIQAFCDSLLENSPELFAMFEGGDQDQVVGMVEAFRNLGLEEKALLGTIYERAKYERLHIGGRTEARIRFTGRSG